MRNSYNKPHKNRTFLYAILIAVVLGISAVVVQDINITAEHTSKNIELKLEQ